MVVNGCACVVEIPVADRQVGTGKRATVEFCPVDKRCRRACVYFY